MASKAAPVCPTCKEHYNCRELHPRLLGCGHSVCSSCLPKMCKDNLITCPLCKHITSVPTCNFDGLIRDLKCFAFLEDMKPSNCELCENKHEATYRCVDCEQDMCNVGRNMHARLALSKEHTIHALPAKEQFAPLKCEKHNLNFCYFDYKCSSVICPKCATSSEHKGHNCTPTDEAAGQFRQDCDGFLDKLNSQIVAMNEAQRAVAVVSAELERNVTKVKEDICKFTEEICAAAVLRRNVLLDELEEIRMRKAIVLSAQGDLLQVFQINLDGNVKGIKQTIERGRHLDVIAKKLELSAINSSFETNMPPLKPLTKSFVSLSFPRHAVLENIKKAGTLNDGSTCVEKTTASGEGLVTARAGKEATFTITTKDKDGNISVDDDTMAVKIRTTKDEHGRTNAADDTFAVSITRDTFPKCNVNKTSGMNVSAQSKSNVLVQKKGDGTYNVYYKFKETCKDSECSVSVVLGDHDIKGSPFRVRLKDDTIINASVHSHSGCYRSFGMEYPATDTLKSDNGVYYAPNKASEAWIVYNLQGVYTVRAIKFHNNGSSRCGVKSATLLSSNSPTGPWTTVQVLNQLNLADNDLHLFSDFTGCGQYWRLHMTEHGSCTDCCFSFRRIMFIGYKND